MRLAAFQFRPPHADPPAARAALLAAVERAAGFGADLLVCPEMATSGYIFRGPAEVAPVAEGQRGESFAALSAAARAHGMWVVCGFPERLIHPGTRQKDGRALATLFNSALVVTGEGALAACYRKVLLYEADVPWASPGNRRAVCHAPFGKLVPGICMDLNDDGFIAHLHEAAPAVVAFSTHWLEEGAEVLPYWQARLGGLGAWFVAANGWGESRGVRFSGRSAILAPGGAPVAVAPAEGDALLVVDTETCAVLCAG
jgi:predicted amidohydrolase